MKFKDKNGNIFTSVDEMRKKFCPSIINTIQDKCWSCPLCSCNNGTGQFCDEYVIDNPAKAASLMGYDEMIKDETKVYEKEIITARPRELQDIINDLQEIIDSYPDNLTTERYIIFCMARDYLKEYFEKCETYKRGKINEQKPLKDWTLKEIESYCLERGECTDCLLNGKICNT